MNKTDLAVSELLSMIRSGRFSEGDRLPTEPELVDELGVSRSAVREAVQSLSFAGILHVRQGGGTFVTDLDPARLLRSAGMALDLSNTDTLAELYEVRRILEPAACAMAVANLTDSDLDTLAGHLQSMRGAAAAEDFVQADIAFHDTIAAIAGNPTLRAILQTLRSESGLGLIRRAREEDGVEAEAILEHEAILEALRSRDSELARAATTVHLAKGQRWLEGSTADSAERADSPE